MGCLGCELFPPPASVLEDLDAAARKRLLPLESGRIFQSLIEEAYRKIERPGDFHRPEITNTNLWHLRWKFHETLRLEHGPDFADDALAVLESRISCYAARLHCNKGASILSPEKTPHKGHAPTFETLKTFEGRVETAAQWKDLLGRERADGAWKNGLPRMIFVSDMGDAFSSREYFEFLERDTLAAIRSAHGQRHLWLWVTKRPWIMRDFCAENGPFPENVCALTTVTGRNSLNRLRQLREVPARVRGLSVEPLWEALPLESLDLSGIDWVIIGGESASKRAHCKPFDVRWLEELRDLCRSQGVAFFAKQLGTNPVRDGVPLVLKSSHGGDWEEWDPGWRVREFPRHFYEYRSLERLRGINTGACTG